MFTPISYTRKRSNLTSAAKRNNGQRKKNNNTDTLINKKIQAKLTIGQPNDKYEQEADRVADQVMRMPNAEPVKQEPWVSPIHPLLQRQPLEEEEEELQAKPLLQMQPTEEEEESIQTKRNGSRNPVKRKNLENHLYQSKGSGSSLPRETRRFMENTIGTDFSKVKVHTDNIALQMNKGLNAQAFTHQNDIYFSSGRYNPDSSEGRFLLAHELTHVVQQNGNDTSIQRQEGEERYEAATEETEPATSLSPDAVSPIIYPQLPLFDLNNDMRFKLLFMPPQPDIPALIRPFTMRGLLVSEMEFNSILQNWNYAYNFYFDLGLDPDSSKWLADKSMSFAYDTQLSLEYPSTIESMERSGQLPESTTFSVDVFSF
ncbi:MAG: DUF4157 domain-containing protein [Thermodesulfobacteriota bacterium]|nr:DUF4157 domain-containing protein [Thermodesulfobacteriota bacterium]